MITTHAVKYIEEILKQKAIDARYESVDNLPDRWGFDEYAQGASNNPSARKGLFIVLYRVEGTVHPDRDEIPLLAVSTRIPGTKIYQVVNSGTSTKTITIDNVPYTETISVVNSSNQNGAGEYPKANRFALVEGVSVSDPTEHKIIDQGGIPQPKYILDTGATYNVLFEGAIQNEQTIEPDNSFALTNIAIKFNDN